MFRRVVSRRRMSSWQMWWISVVRRSSSAHRLVETDLLGGLGGDLGEGTQILRAALPQMGQSERTVRIVEEAADPPQGVVAGGAGAGEVPGQLLVGLQDLLHHGPGPAGRPLEVAQVAARVGQTVGMIDAIAVDHALALQPQQRLVGRLEHLRQLDADRGERVDVEEPSVVQLVVGDLPIGQAVPLAVQQVRESQMLGAGGDREHVVEVPHHGFLRGGAVGLADLLHPQLDLPVGQHRADGVSQHRHQDRALGRRIDVEPVGVGRVGAVAQGRPQGAVVPDRGRDRHVVGHHVHDQPHAVVVRRRGETAQAVLSADLRADPRVVHHVVPVGRAGGGLQDGEQNTCPTPSCAR